MKILAFIPAKKNSTGLKNKNFKKLNKKPLIFYTINFIKKFNSIVPFVSTDSKKILRYAKRFNINFNYLRPKKLSGNKSNIIDAVLDALNWLEKRNLFFDAVLLLQPTSPIRLKSELSSMISQFKKQKLDSIATAIKYDDVKDTVELINKNKFKYLSKKNKGITNRQSIKGKFYVFDGSMFLSRVTFLKKFRSFVKERETKIFITNLDLLIDIDSIIDFKIAEFLIKEFYKQ